MDPSTAGLLRRLEAFAAAPRGEGVAPAGEQGGGSGLEPPGEEQGQGRSQGAVRLRPPLPLSQSEERRLCDECRELLLCRAHRRLTFLQFVESLWRVGRARWSRAGGVSDSEVQARWTDAAVVGLSALGSRQAHGVLARVAGARLLGAWCGLGPDAGGPGVAGQDHAVRGFYARCGGLGVLPVVYREED